MGKRYLIGVDLGTSATKAALYNIDGTLVSEACQEVPLYYPKPGVVEQENDDFYRTAAMAVHECVQSSGIDPKEIAGVAFDSQMAGIGSIDENYQPATRFDSWLDMRCKPYIEDLEKNHSELVTRLTGCAPTCDHGPKMLWWKGERPEEYKKIAKFLTPAAYVAGRLAGLKGDDAFMDYTFLHFSGFVDAKAGVWSKELCQTLGFDMDKLPRIVEPWHIIGEVTPTAAKDFGLAAGTPIAAGCGDTAAGALGAGIVRNGMIFDTAGTASVFAGCTDQFVADIKNKALLCMRSVIPGLWNPLAYIAGGGLALRWFRDQFFNTSQGKSLEKSEDLFDRMIAMAAEIEPGCDGLFFSPHLGGRICPADPDMRGSWVGFSWGHTQAHFFRSVLESVAFEYDYYLRILKENIPNLHLIEARVVGGGSRSPIWNQIKADILDIPYQPLQGSEFGSWGSAMIAGHAAGVYSNLTETAEKFAIIKGEALKPRKDIHSRYGIISDQYIKWQSELSHGFHSINIQ